MKRVLVSAGIVIALLVGTASPARAHNADTSTFGNFYRYRTILNMRYNVGPNTWWSGAGYVPGLADAVTRGMINWDSLQPADNIHFDANFASSTLNEASPCSNPTNVNGLFWTNIAPYTPDPNTLAIATTCANSSEYPGDPRRIRVAAIRFDGDRPNWYFQPGTTVPVGFNDLESVAAHELGHVLGFFQQTTPGSNGVSATHWESPAPGLAQVGQVNGNTLCPGQSTARHTMCSVIEQGTSYLRSPASHDQHTVYNKYGPGYP